MCILLTTNANKDYPFILISNRDEYFKRATQCATFHTFNNKNIRILSPLDMARKDHGTWIALNPENHKFAILVNFREGLKEAINPVSRGVLPLDYVISDADSRNGFLNELSIRYNDSELLQKIGGFNLLFGNLDSTKTSCSSFDIISNKNTADFKIFTSNKGEYHGLSNSSFDEPWEKVKIGEEKLKQVIEDYNLNSENEVSYSNISSPSCKDELITKLFELLSYNTLGNITQDFQGNFENIKNTIFVPPLKVRDFNRNNPLAGEYYGTRTQTIIMVDKIGHVTYIEKNLHSSDDLNEQPHLQTYEFDI